MNRFHVMVMMKREIHILFVVLGILVWPTHGKLFSQERFPKKHKYEIGTALGASTYIGDANPKNPFLYLEWPEASFVTTPACNGR